MKTLQHNSKRIPLGYSTMQLKFAGVIALFFMLLQTSNVSAQTYYNFTNCGQTGNTGPTQAQVNATYTSGNTLYNAVTSYSGRQYWVVPATGTYKIDAWGAAGGSGSGAFVGGKGAYVSATYNLTAGTGIYINVGQMGSSYYDGGSNGYRNHGGGGATWVHDNNNNLMMVAGGGGGAAGSACTSAPYNGADAPAANGTGDGTSSPKGGVSGGSSGNGGNWNSGDNSGAGGGLWTNGTGYAGNVGQGLRNNGHNPSGASYVTAEWARGGYGGGGGGWGQNGGGGGGGGFSGGNNGFSYGGGGAGGSAIMSGGFNTSSSAGSNPGHGAVQIAAMALAPTVTTTAASSVATTTATSGGNVTAQGTYAVTERGVCWSTSQNPTTSNTKTTDGSGTGSFTSSITGLSAGTTYYVRAYATNSGGTNYGSQISFTTTAATAPPTVTTQAVSSIATTTATGNGNITNLGVPNPTQYGVVWSTSTNPTVALTTKTAQGAIAATGAFTSSITGLAANTTYYVKAYATNTAGTSYGTEVSFTTNKLSQTITFNALSDKTYGDADYSPGATASSALAITYTSTNASVATIVSGQIHIVGAGATTISANQAGDGSYYAASQVSQTLTVAKKALTITADAKSKVYGQTDPALTYQITTGALVGADALTGSLSRVAGEDVGDYAISSSLANANYTITFVPADLSITEKAITITADAKSKVYGQTDPALTYQITTGALVGADALTGSLSRATGEDVGDYAISSTLANTNYTITFVPADLSITEKAITITADAKSKVYGQTDPALTYQITTGALVGADALTGSLSRATGEDVGDYAISSTLANTNYTITFVPADLSITEKAITITADAKSKVYGQTDPALSYQITTGALVGADALTGSLSRATGEDVGDYAIGSTLANTNYTITFVPADLSITEKALTITADAKSKVYGETDPALTYQITTGALVGTDALTGSLSRAAGEAVGDYAISSTLANANYNITFVPANLSITEKAITITADAKTKVYGDEDPALTYQITTGALVGTDALTGSLSRAAGEAVGDYAISSTLANANYTITFVPANLSITEKAITITADAKTKVYGDEDPALTYQITTGALVGTDALTGSLSRAAGEAVGDYAISSTLANANYNITFVPANLSITEKAITITADAKTKVYGDEDPALTYQITTGALVGADALTGSLSRAAGENVGDYAISSTLANTNYTITFVPANLSITEKAITITADAKTKVYGDEDPALTYQITTGALVGADALTGSLSRATGEDVGDYAISSTLANTNYTITFVPADLSITEKAITITADAKSKVYGQEDPALTYQITTGALVGADALTGSLSRAAGENVGDYAISSTLANTNYTITFVPADLSITEKAMTITADAKSKVYGQTDPALTYQITTGALVGADALTGSLSRAAGEDVGDYAISSTLANTNYTITFVPADLSITEKAMTITADAKSKVYGQTDPALTYQITTGALVGADALTGSLSRAAGEDVGDYAISSTLANTNYTITFVPADLSITEKAITITADAKSKVYGQTDPALTYQITTGALVGTDALTGSLSRAAGEDVGDYAISSTLANTNYTITFVPADLSITEKAITITADAKSKVYGQTDPALTYQITRLPIKSLPAH